MLCNRFQIKIFGLVNPHSQLLLSFSSIFSQGSVLEFVADLT